MRNRTFLLAATPIVALVAVVLAWPTAAPPPGPPAGAVPVASDAAVPSQHGRIVRSAASMAVPSAPAKAAPRVAPAADRAAQVDRWADSPDPADAMLAYRAAFDCLQARRDERRPAEDVARERQQMEDALPQDQRAGIRTHWAGAAATCGNLRSDQVQRRMQWLRRAAQAGVPMAAMEFVLEGPAGDGLLQDLGVPRPPLTDAWRAERDAFIDAALQRCDMGLVGYLGMSLQGDCKDLGQMLNFWSAHSRCPGSPEPVLLLEDPVALRYLHDLGNAGLQAPQASGG
jgi:hypothetical protein